MKKLGAHGYTLFELLVATAISGLILVGVMTFLISSLVNNSVNTARADLLREAQLALDVMVKDIRLSASAEQVNRWADDHSPNADTTNGFGWSSDANTLVLATAATRTDNSVIFSDVTHYITEKDNIIYYVADDTLYRRTLAADLPDNAATSSCPPQLASSSCPADRLSVKNVTGLTFRYFDASNNEVEPEFARSVEANLNLHAVKFGRDIDVNYTTRTVFRNE